MFVTVNRLIGFYLDLKRKRLKENRFVGLRTETSVSRIGNDQEQIPMNVFTVMPFSGPATQIWEAGIRVACQELGFECLRSDLVSTPGFVVTQIYESIAAAGVIIGEMSEKNVNVFYEIGFAHALGKHTVLLATSADDLKAFDTQGRRHFLHGGNPERAREYLAKTLREIEQRLVVEPEVPQGMILYEWPKAASQQPKLAWQSRSEERRLQLDIDGGQRIVDAGGIGQVLCISNTADLWNHRSGWSIMTLLVTKDLATGDVLHLFLDARATGGAELEFLADGGWVETAGGRKWAQAVPVQKFSIGPSAAWMRWTRTVTVAPTYAEYDLKRGAAIYILTQSQRFTVLLKRIQLVRRPAS